MYVVAENDLQHYGILGMHWGKRKAQYDNLSRLDRISKRETKAEKAAVNEKRNTDIDNARVRQMTTNVTEYADAKKQYKQTKMVIGKVAAKKALNKVRDRHYADDELAAQLKSGSETTNALIASIFSDMAVARLAMS